MVYSLEKHESFIREIVVEAQSLDEAIMKANEADYSEWCRVDYTLHRVIYRASEDEDSLYDDNEHGELTEEQMDMLD